MSPQEQILPHGRILRYSFRERLIHWIAGFSYVYLLFTGLAFWSPWLFWLALWVWGGQGFPMLPSLVCPLFFFARAQMSRVWATQMRWADSDRALFGSVAHCGV